METSFAGYIIFSLLTLSCIPFSVISLFLSFHLLRNYQQDRARFYFGMSLLLLSFWLIIIPLIFFAHGIEIRKIIVVSNFFLGAWIMHFFLLFTAHLYFRNKSYDYIVFIQYLLTIVISLMIFTDNFLVLAAEGNFPFLRLTFSRVGLIVYTSFFILMTGASFINLVKRHDSTDGIVRVKIRRILWTTMLAIVANLVLSVCVYYFTTFDTNPLGALFTFVVLIYTHKLLYEDQK